MKSLFELPRLGSEPDAPFPPTRRALESPNGLLAWGGDLHPRRLLAAYRAGIFPWYSDGQPVLWWSPAPRCVIFPDQVHLARRTRRRYNQGRLRLTTDHAFAEVIAACAEPRRRDGGTWITPDLQKAFHRLHELGHAHSLEVWDGETLYGGIYGLAIGAAFFGESMFSRGVDGSKIALVGLARQLAAWGYDLLDCQVANPHLFRMGAVELDRTSFERLLAAAVAQSPAPHDWAAPTRLEPPW